MVSAHRPTHALRHLVKYYYQVEGNFTSLVALQPVPARSPEILEFMFATPYIVERLHHGTTARCCDVALVGMKTHRHVNLYMRDRVDAFTIAFQPGGLLALLGIPSCELTDGDCDARDAVGREIDVLRERLAGKTTIAERARIADEYLCARLAGGTDASPVILAARLLHRCLGSVQIAQLAERTSLGVRHFERRFVREIGMPPKLYARIVRFESALRLKSLNPSSRWTDIAYRLGYCDHMHMIHDFKRLSGNTPTGIIDQLDMFVKPEVDLHRQA